MYVPRVKNGTFSYFLCCTSSFSLYFLKKNRKQKCLVLLPLQNLCLELFSFNTSFDVSSLSLSVLRWVNSLWASLRWFWPKSTSVVVVSAMVAKAITIEWERDLSFPPRPKQVYFLKDLVTLGFNTFKRLKKFTIQHCW